MARLAPTSILACILLLAVFPVFAESPGKLQRCASILQEIDRINQRMRQPYGAREGEILRARLKKLSDRLYECRKGRRH